MSSSKRARAKQIVYYWFVQRGRKVANEYWSKWYLFADAISKNRTDGALVRLTTPIYPNESERDADERLRSFMPELEARLGEYLPPRPLPTRQVASCNRLKASIVRSCHVPVASKHRSADILPAPCCLLSPFSWLPAAHRSSARKATTSAAWSSSQRRTMHGRASNSATRCSSTRIWPEPGSVSRRSKSRTRNWQAVARILRTVVELDPKNIDTKLRLTRLLLLGNALDEALKLVNAAGELDSRNTGVLTTRAAILLKLERQHGCHSRGAGGARDRSCKCGSADRACGRTLDAR